MSELEILEMTADNYRERALGAEDLAWELWLELRRMSTDSEFEEIKRRLGASLGDYGRESFRKLQEVMQGDY